MNTILYFSCNSKCDSKKSKGQSYAEFIPDEDDEEGMSYGENGAEKAGSHREFSAKCEFFGCPCSVVWKLSNTVGNGIF